MSEEKKLVISSSNYDAELASSLVMKRKLDKFARTERGKLLKKQKNDAKRQRRDERKKLREQHGEEAVPKLEPRTIESTKEEDKTVVEDDDEEVLHDQMFDEMGAYFNRETTPKIVLTTSPKAKAPTVKFLYELRKIMPGADMYPRKNIPVKKIVKQAIEANFTDLMIVHEDKRKGKPDGLILCHLPKGPTAYFKINSLKYSKEIKGVGESTHHYPEVILNNFNSRLGLLVSRMLVCLFPQDPNFVGRRVVTFHNQRDYIFFRHHRYEFKREGEKAALHELGPRFTLRLKWLQKGTFNPTEGEYEWVLKRHEMETSRRRFFL